MKGAKPILKKALDAFDEPPMTPGWLCAHAREEWERVTPALVARGILTIDNLASLESYCIATGHIRTCEITIQQQASPYVSSENSAPRPHPAFRILQTNMTLQRQLAAELGLTPVSRSRPAMVQPNDGSEWDGLADE